MGNFSYVCKGCGQELREREHVRLNGCVGMYDGYGNAGGYHYSFGDHGDPAAWHQVCYMKASNEAKLDDTPSEPARNQGFGMKRLEFLLDFNPEAKTVFLSSIEIPSTDAQAPYKSQILWMTDKGPEDHEAWVCERRRIEDALEATGTSTLEQWAEMDKIRDSDAAPLKRAIKYETLDDAHVVAYKMLAKLGGPKEHSIRIFGVQGSIMGVVYEFDAFRAIDGAMKAQSYEWSRE